MLQLGMLGWFSKYNWKCQPVDYSDNPDATAVSASFSFIILILSYFCSYSVLKIKRIFKNLQMAHLAWWYYLSKFLEFTDTVSNITVFVQYSLDYL